MQSVQDPSREPFRRSFRRGFVAPALVLAALYLVTARSASAADYAALHSSAVGHCQTIDPNAYQTGLIFNPEGYHSMYLRSECLQNAAVTFRDASLCSQVRQRWSLFSSSWGVAPDRCRKLVSDGIASDRIELENEQRVYTGRALKLQSFRVERNGNGRDFDLIPQLSADYPHAYNLTFEILQPGTAGAPILLYSSGSYLDAKPNLRIYIRQADIRHRFPGFRLAHPYQVRLTVILDTGFGGPSGYWSDAFIESVFPLRQRSQSLTRKIVF